MLSVGLWPLSRGVGWEHGCEVLAGAAAPAGASCRPSAREHFPPLRATRWPQRPSASVGAEQRVGPSGPFFMQVCDCRVTRYWGLREKVLCDSLASVPPAEDTVQ